MAIAIATAFISHQQFSIFVKILIITSRVATYSFPFQTSFQDHEVLQKLNLTSTAFSQLLNYTHQGDCQ